MFDYKLLNASCIGTAAALLTSAAIGAGASLAGTGASIAANANINKKNRAWQEKMYNLAVENNRQDATTAYERQQTLMDLAAQKEVLNTELNEIAKMKGFKQALKETGINPMYALGIQGTAGNSTPTAPQAQAAGYGNPQTFAPNIMDLSASIKNMAEAGLANAKAKTEEGVQQKVQEEIEVLAQSIKESEQRIAESKAKINLTNINATWQEIQNRIASATEETEISIKKQELKNLEQAWDKDFEIIKGLQEENKVKAQELANYLKLQQAQILKTHYEGIRNKIASQKELQEYKRFNEILDASIRTAVAEAKNAEDFQNRFNKEMEQRGKELKQRKTQQWLNFTNGIMHDATAIYTRGYSTLGNELMNQAGSYTTNSTY